MNERNPINPGDHNDRFETDISKFTYREMSTAEGQKIGYYENDKPVAEALPIADHKDKYRVVHYSKTGEIIGEQSAVGGRMALVTLQEVAIGTWDF